MSLRLWCKLGSVKMVTSEDDKSTLCLPHHPKYCHQSINSHFDLRALLQAYQSLNLGHSLLFISLGLLVTVSDWIYFLIYLFIKFLRRLSNNLRAYSIMNYHTCAHDWHKSVTNLDVSPDMKIRNQYLSALWHSYVSVWHLLSYYATNPHCSSR